MARGLHTRRSAQLPRIFESRPILATTSIIAATASELVGRLSSALGQRCSPGGISRSHGSNSTAPVPKLIQTRSSPLWFRLPGCGFSIRVVSSMPTPAAHIPNERVSPMAPCLDTSRKAKSDSWCRTRPPLRRFTTRSRPSPARRSSPHGWDIRWPAACSVVSPPPRRGPWRRLPPNKRLQLTG